MKKLFLTSFLLTGLLTTPVNAQTVDVSPEGGMTFLATLFNKICIQDNYENTLKQNMSYAELKDSTSLQDAQGWNVIYKNIHFNLIKAPHHCSVSIGTPSGINNLSPLNYQISLFNKKHNTDIIKLPVEEETINNIEHRYQTYAFADKNKNLLETWYLDYSIYHGKNIPDNFIFDDSNRGFDSIKVSLTRLY